MNNSILTDIKKLLGMEESYTAFDTDIIIHINSVFSILYQMGVSPKDGFSISDKSSKWSDFLVEEINNNYFLSIKTYVFMKVSLMFDPPENGNLMKAREANIKELEYRLYTEKGGY